MTGSVRIQLINAHRGTFCLSPDSLTNQLAETGEDDCIGNECSDTESEQTRRVGREAARAADRQRKTGLRQ